MKSVIGTIIIFIGIYAVLATGITGFFAQKSFLIFAICAAIFMLVVAVLVLGVPGIKNGGDNHDEDNHLD